MLHQPIITDVSGKRRFACSAVALVNFIVNEEEKFLLLSSPPERKQEDGWETISGALEAGETVLEGALREVREEVGPDVQVRPLGTVHAYTFHYDDNVKFMISICYLMAYEGGQVRPGDDMQGSRYRWWGLEELENDNVTIVVPTNRKWLLRRTIELYRLWNESQIDLQQLELKSMG